MNNTTKSNDGLYEADDLREVFAAQFPDACEQEIAALMAAFLEEVPAVTTTDDGVQVEQYDEEAQAALKEWIAELKAFAGAAYPPRSGIPS